MRRRILRYETDVDGMPIEDFPGVLVVCDDPRALGDLAGIVPYVLYKRNSIADWAQFCSVFGIPIREVSAQGPPVLTNRRHRRPAQCPAKEKDDPTGRRPAFPSSIRIQNVPHTNEVRGTYLIPNRCNQGSDDRLQVNAYRSMCVSLMGNF